MGQFTLSVTQPIYHNLRLMFIEKLGLRYDFDFHRLIVRGMEDELANTVRTEWPLWVFAAIFIALPNRVGCHLLCLVAETTGSCVVPKSISRCIAAKCVDGCCIAPPGRLRKHWAVQLVCACCQ